MGQRLVVAAAALACAVAPATAGAEAFARVLTQRAKVRTGPGVEYRVIYTAERGQVLRIVERGTKGYWFRVELDDGSTGWIFGEQLQPFDIVDDEEPGFFGRLWRSTRRALFGPTPLPHADVELSFSAGALGGEGLFLFRPAWIVDTHFAIEGFVGESPRKQESLLVGGVGWTLRLAPGGPVGPYLNAGVGVAYFEPKEDAFTLEPRTLAVVNAGGGLEVTIKLRLTLRFDFRHWTFFDPNEAANAKEFTGGMAIFF